MFCRFGVCLRLSARSAGDIWGFICANRLSTLACYSPADSADYAEEYSKLYYFAEKDMLMWFMRLLLFGFCLRLSARSARYIWGFISAY